MSRRRGQLRRSPDPAVPHRPRGASGNSVHLPLTQPQVGDVLGLSPVHVNRVTNRLEQDGLIRRDGYTYELLDLPKLEALAAVPRRVLERNPTWFPPAGP